MYHIKDIVPGIISLRKRRGGIAMFMISWILMMIAFGLLCYLWKEELKEEDY